MNNNCALFLFRYTSKSLLFNIYQDNELWDGKGEKHEELKIGSTKMQHGVMWNNLKLICDVYPRPTLGKPTNGNKVCV